MINYISDEFKFEEMPFGMVLIRKNDGETFIISSLKDAEAIAESLNKFIKSKEKIE